MFSRRTLLRSSPLAAFALISAPRYVQGPEGLALPSTSAITTPLPQPLVVATEMPLTRVEVSKGYPETYYSIGGTVTQIQGHAECKIVMYLTQIGNLQKLMGKEVTLYVEESTLES